MIGNQDYYDATDLGNARKDAEDIAAMLRDFRFKVFDGYDLEKREFEELLRTAVLNIPEGADVVFYYAGHGIQIGRRNYLLPVDAKFESIYDLPLETMTLDRVIDTLAARGSAHVAILDSCRDNPFANIRLAADLDANLFETRSGFDVFRTPLNSLIAYSTSPGATALDGDVGGNSPYTAAVLAAARSAPAENIQQLFPLIREKVHSATGGQQVPWESSTLVRPFFLTTAAEEEPVDRGVELVSTSISIVDRFDRTVPLDDAIEAELGLDIQTANLIEAPRNGLINLNGAEGAVSFVPEIDDIRAQEVQSTTVTDSFTLQVASAQGEARRVDVSVELNMDACDLEAGDALDLNGVGVFRLPNELNIRSGMAACEAAVRQNPENARFRYQLGRLQQSNRQYEDAYANFQAAAEAGHIRAKYALAVLLDTPRLDRAVIDVPLDRNRARALLDEAIAEQDPFAMHKLGKEMMRNGETEAERKRGFELLERSVELGHTYSMNELGFYFLTKDSDHYIPERGMRYLRASQLREDIYGYNNLAFVALNGLDGNPPDAQKARQLYQIAADGGHPVAPANIARMILRGQLGEKDFTEALSLYDMSLERGDGWGGTNGAVIILNGNVPGRGPADAALRAAKAVHLANEKAAATARERLDSLDRDALDRALQMALNELGQSITVDGQVGPATVRALETASAEYGVPLAFGSDTDPLQRLIQATRIYWAKNPVRFDLF
ncbi:caspase family protein [Cribrihabitans marinus]|uniref:caspase family protein n=1 Tax=Cribrihabitans marinus TaxID=1227549 RepID=UPI0015A7167D|nr:caspase family protein [Cribrihabitans marinus]